MNFIASYALFTFTIGNIGPKISSFMTGSVGLTLIRIVGAMYFSAASVCPPIATSPFERKDTKRLKI